MIDELSSFECNVLTTLGMYDLVHRDADRLAATGTVNDVGLLAGAAGYCLFQRFATH